MLLSVREIIRPPQNAKNIPVFLAQRPCVVFAHSSNLHLALTNSSIIRIIELCGENIETTFKFGFGGTDS